MNTALTICADGIVDKLTDVNPSRRELDPHEVELARRWIRLFATPTKTIRRRYYSYGYKHAVERWTEKSGFNNYISNGAFIQAALLEGYRCAPIRSSSLNAYFNMTVAEADYQGR
jgi:hypothetical protein